MRTFADPGARVTVTVPGGGGGGGGGVVPFEQDVIPTTPKTRTKTTAAFRTIASPQPPMDLSGRERSLNVVRVVRAKLSGGERRVF
jgi:hypothetical protein